MRSEECRIIVYDGKGQRVGCGFIADSRHVMTCSHVVESAQNNASPFGDGVSIRTNGGETLGMSAVKTGDAGLDLCVLKRIDGASFAPTSCALWASGRPGQRFTGLGMNKDYTDGVSLSGTLGAYAIGEALQIITAGDKDNRVEEGASGAPIFEEALSDGPLFGMVAEFQQEKTGKIIPSKALADFWPGLRRFDAQPEEPLPAMLDVAVDGPVVDRLVREIDRSQQRRLFKDAVDRRQLLTGHGFLIATLSGLWADLPDRCAGVLGGYALARIMQQIAPDTAKPNIMANKIGDLLADTEREASYNLLSALSWRYRSGTDFGEVRAEMARETVPLTILVTATVADLPRVTAKAVAGWAKCLSKLAMPEQRKPIMLFLMVMRDEEASRTATAPPIEIVRKPWYVGLPELTPIDASEVRTWALELPGDLPGRRARAQIETILEARLGARSAGAASFRLKELESWFSAA